MENLIIAKKKNNELREKDKNRKHKIQRRRYQNKVNYLK